MQMESVVQHSVQVQHQIPGVWAVKHVEVVVWVVGEGIKPGIVPQNGWEKEAFQ